MKTFEAAQTRDIRKICARLKPGCDLFQGIKDVCNHYNIKNASIDSAIGSMSSASLLCISKDTSSPSGASYKEPKNIEGPLELLPTMGTVGEDGEGLSIHLHGAVAPSEEICIAGHFADTGKNIVLATVELYITELTGISWTRRFDEETGFPLFRPEENKN